MGYLDKLKTLKMSELGTNKTYSVVETKIPEMPNPDTLKTLKRGADDTDTPPATIRGFVADCCTLEPGAGVAGGDLYAAFAAWRRVVHASDWTPTWQALAAYLEQHGCTRTLRDGKALWHGAALKPDGPHTAPVEAQENAAPVVGRHGTPCPQCGDTWQWPTTTGEWLCSWCFAGGKRVLRDG